MIDMAAVFLLFPPMLLEYIFVVLLLPLLPQCIRYQQVEEPSTLPRQRSKTDRPSTSNSGTDVAASSKRGYSQVVKCRKRSSGELREVKQARSVRLVRKGGRDGSGVERTERKDECR